MQEGAIYACISDLVGVGYVRRNVLVDLCSTYGVWLVRPDLV